MKRENSAIKVILVAGVSGAGKTTVGKLLAISLGWDFEDADELHPIENIRKMSQGEPLNDQDRWPWLARVRSCLDSAIRQERGLVLACSALRNRYVTFLTEQRPQVRLAFLRVDPETLATRLAKRSGHFFAPELLASQLEIQQFPASEWVFDGNLPAAEVAREIALRFGL